MPLSFCPSTFLSLSLSLSLFVVAVRAGKFKGNQNKNHKNAQRGAFVKREREKAKGSVSATERRIEGVRERERNVALARQDEKLLLFMAEVDNAKDEQDAGDDDAAAAC